MIIQDNLTRLSADLKMSKMPKLDWTRTAVPSSLLLSPEGFGVKPQGGRQDFEIGVARSKYDIFLNEFFGQIYQIKTELLV